ncbi:MAG: hypothetical protein R3E82_05545 [Pseudomonadales bacterium]
MKSKLLRVFSSILLFNVLVIYMPSTASGMLIAALISALLLLLNYANGVLFASSALVCTLILEALLRLTGGVLPSPYYRPHEFLVEGDRYRSNEDVSMLSPHGDLLAIDPTLDRALAYPKQLEFKTDSIGYRNVTDYGGEKLILIGDSFVVGNGNTQADSLSEIMRREQGISSYSMAFPNGPLGYSRIADEARTRFGPDICLVIAFFEGNDFQPIDKQDLALRQMTPSLLRTVAKNYSATLKEWFEVSKVFYGLYTQSLEKIRLSIASTQASSGNLLSESKTIVEQVGGTSMAFLSGYAEVTRREEYDDFGFLENQLASSRPDLVLFIPEKYRVYSALMNRPVQQLPDAQLSLLRRVTSDLGIELIDSTKALEERSRVLLESGEFTFWPDDTHWNRNGIEVAAKLLAAGLLNSTAPACVAAAPSNE